MSQLTINNVTVRFGGHTALNNVSMTVESGTITGLIGPNGAGKTTLFNVVSGLQRADEGEVILNGEIVTNKAPYKRARCGLGRTFQRLELFPSLTVEENIRVSGEIRNQWASNDENRNIQKSIDQKMEEIITLTGLADSADYHVAEIPTGKARLVELARTLMPDPKLILLDEPASGQNDLETAEFGYLLQKLTNEGITIFLVEHDMSVVMSVCDHVHVLDFGSIIADGSTNEIQTNKRVIDAYLGSDQ